MVLFFPTCLPADGVRARQGHDFLVGESHTMKDLPKVGGSVRAAIPKGRIGAGKIPFLGALLRAAGVYAAVAHVDFGP